MRDAVQPIPLFQALDVLNKRRITFIENVLGSLDTIRRAEMEFNHLRAETVLHWKSVRINEKVSKLGSERDVFSLLVLMLEISDLVHEFWASGFQLNVGKNVLDVGSHRH